MQILKLCYAIVLILLGTFLEWRYYVSRFESDGIESWMAWLIALALNVLLGAAVLYRAKRFGRILMIAVVCYSIINTNAGQEFSFSVKQKNEAVADSYEANAQDTLAELIQRNRDIAVEEKQILLERSKNLIGSAEVTRRQTPLREEREANRIRIEELRGKLTTHSSTETSVSEKKAETNTYSFYEKLTGIPQEWLRFGFHLILSVFIALMTPLGLQSLPALQSSAKETPKSFPSWWAKVNCARYALKKARVPKPMLIAQAVSAGYAAQDVEEIELFADSLDLSRDPLAVAKAIESELKKRRKT